MSIGKLRGTLTVFALVFFAACSDNDNDPPPPAASETIGVAGGTVEVSEGELAGTTLVVPADALTADQTISIYEDSYSKEPGMLPLGPAARFEPTDLVYALNCQFTLIFDSSYTPTGTPDSAFQVGHRAANGVVDFLTPSSVDQAAGTVQLDYDQQGTFWVVIPDEFRIEDYLPLNSGDTYNFNNNLTVSVAVTSNEPNFPLTSFAKMSFFRPGITEGMYLDYVNGALRYHGRFRVPDVQEQLDAAVILLDAIAPIPGEQDVTYTYKGYMPYGSSFIAYTGISLTATRPNERTTVSVPAGNFDDCIELIFDTVYRNTLPLYGSTSTTWWLARDVGPVRIKTEDGRTYDLVSGNTVPTDPE